MPAIKDCLSLSEVNKELGNAAFVKGNHEGAAPKYKEGLRLIEEVLLKHYAGEWVVKQDGSAAPVHAEPSLAAAVVQQLEPGIHVRGERDSAGWLHLQDPDGKAGFLDAWLLVDGQGWKVEPAVDDQQRQQAQKVRMALRLNMAQVSLKQGHWVEAMEHSSVVLELDADNGKALYRRALAAAHIASMGKAEQAQGDLVRAIELQPNDREVRDALVAAKARMKEYKSWWEAAEEEGWPQLLLASQEECTQKVGLLLESRAAVDTAGPDSWTALQLASERGYGEIVEKLLAAGAAVDLAGGASKTTALLYAVQGGFHQVVGQLLEARADVDVAAGQPTEEGGGATTALMISAQLGHQEVMQKVLTAGPSLDLVDGRGISALMLAAQAGRADLVSKLICANASHELRMHAAAGGGSALMLTAQAGHLPVVAQLLTSRADADLVDAAGRNALMYAVHFDRADVVKRLLEARSGVNQADASGWTPLMLAVQGPHLTVMDRLLEARASPETVAGNGCSALRLAAEKGEHKVVSKLLEAKACVNETDEMGHSPLILAVMGGAQGRVLDILLAASASVEARTKEAGRDALMLAAADGHTEAVNRLLQARASPNVVDSKGESACRLAASQGRHRVLDRLREAGGTTS